MRERGFERFVRAKAPGFSDGEFRVAVHALDDAECDLASRREPVEQERAVRAQGLGETLHGRQPGPHRAGAPLVEEPSCPGGALVGPETLERLLAQEGTDGSQGVAQDLAQLPALVDCLVLLALEEAPTRVLQDGL